MNFAGFGFNYVPSTVPTVPVPSLPFYTLADDTAVPLVAGDPAAAEPGLYEGQAPFSALQRSQGAGQRPLATPSVPPRPCAPLKIRRPPNAFMVFANGHRKVLAKAFPRENNQSISVRLGSMWKAMAAENKSIYYQAAKEAAAQHKRLYPSYVYCPKEARMRKQARELVRREKAVKPGCEGDAPSTETRAKLMEVAQLLDSISSDRLPQQARRRSPSSPSKNDPATSETAISPSADTSASPASGQGDPRGPAPTQAREEGAARGQLYQTVSCSPYDRDIHWSVLPYSQADCGPVPRQMQAGCGQIPSQMQADCGPVPRQMQAGCGQIPSQMEFTSAVQQSHAGCGPALPQAPPRSGLALPQAQPCSGPVLPLSQGGGACLPCGRAGDACRGAPGCCPAGRQQQQALGCGHRGGPGVRSQQTWTVAQPAAPLRPEIVHHPSHGAAFHTADTPCQTQLVSAPPAAWPAQHASTATAPVVPLAAASPASRVRAAPPGPPLCGHCPAADSCGHCRPAVCCHPSPIACQARQCHCPGVLGSPQQRQRRLTAPQLLGQPAGLTVNSAQCALPRTAVLHPPERCRRQPVPLRVPDPRATQALRAPPGVDLRSCWQTVAAASAAGPLQEAPRPGGPPPWEAPPPASYLRPPHSPGIEELVGADTEPLGL